MLVAQDSFSARPSLPDQTEPAWHREVHDDLAARLTPPSAFPCTFSQNAFRRGLLRFAFVETLDKPGLAALREDLGAYVREAREWDGQVNTASPLIVAFSHAAIAPGPLAAQQQAGWKVLQDWIDHDPAPWPADVAPDPTAPYWSLCHDGMQLFVNMSSPAHQKRKSRNLGRHFLFVVNPRTRFDVVAGDTPEGRRVRAVIRERAEAYDGMAHAPQLGLYQKGELEWVQYALPDENTPPPARCPIAARGD